MVRIEVDEQVYAELQRRALAFIEREPNDTLRRLLGVGEASGAGGHAPAPRPTRSTRPTRPPAVGPPGPRRGRREQKVQLSALVAAGLLTRGEWLACVDYSGHPIPGGEAEVGTGNKLVMHGRRYSMSALAIELLRKAGHTVDVARGPAHWRTAAGKTVLTLWKEMPRAAS